MTLKEVTDWLILNQYMTYHKGKPIFTEKFRAEAVVSTSLVPTQATSVALSTHVDYEEEYKQFILKCQVPPRGYDNFQRAYAMNKFSKDGAVAYKAAIVKGYNMEVLAMVVHTYYKSSINYKKAIGNYMTSGEWQTDYDTFLTKHEEGKLKEHLKQETHDVNNTSWVTRM